MHVLTRGLLRIAKEKRPHNVGRSSLTKFPLFLVNTERIFKRLSYRNRDAVDLFRFEPDLLRGRNRPFRQAVREPANNRYVSDLAGRKQSHLDQNAALNVIRPRLVRVSRSRLGKYLEC